MSPSPQVAGETPALQLDREIAATHAEIDGLVYDLPAPATGGEGLYGITDEERHIMECTL